MDGEILTPPRVVVGGIVTLVQTPEIVQLIELNLELGGRNVWMRIPGKLPQDETRGSLSEITVTSEFYRNNLGPPLLEFTPTSYHHHFSVI